MKVVMWDEVRKWVRRMGEIRKHKRMERQKKELFYNCNRQFIK